MDIHQLQEVLSGTIDFKGQQKASQLTFNTSIYGVALSILAGLISQRFDVTIVGTLVTYVAVFLLCLPLPIYRKNPVKWTSFS